MTSRGHGLADAHGGLLHTAPVTAIGLLVLNDHVLKAMAPGPITGVLSDLAGLAFFPLLLVAFVELFRLALGRFEGPDDRVLVTAVAATAIVFTLVQLHPAATEAYRLGLAAVQQPFHAARTLLEGAPARRVAATPDPLDLIALPALAVPLLVGRASLRSHRRQDAR